MNQESDDGGSPRQAPNANPPPTLPKPKIILKRLGVLVLLVLSAFAAWTLYVALRQPDRQETVVLGQSTLASGSPAALRILVRDRVSGAPVKNAEVRLSLVGKTVTTVPLGRFRTDAFGTLTDSIPIPELPSGEYQLVLDASSSLGRDHVAKKVEIRHPARLLLSSDKPIYQPGQTIHLRSMVLNGRTQKPFANQPVTFEITDAKGNKVFKETRSASAFGIASADFVLATELNLGRYELHATAGAADARQTVEVKRYVLPKFKIQIVSDQSYYLPGQTVSGSVQADYFFGRPVANATVKLTGATLDVRPWTIRELRGHTDASGKYSFQFTLPDSFVGMPQNNERAFLDLNVEVRDTADHLETKTLSLTVAKNDLDVTAIPENEAFVPGVENALYILTAYPDGRPADCRVTANGTAYRTDAQGACEIRFTPTSPYEHFDIVATDPAGKQARVGFDPDTNAPSPAFILRADRAVYQAGQSGRLTILSPEPDNTVFLDVIKDGQTVMTKSIALQNHKAEYALAFPSSLVGVLKLNAYMITADGEDRGCSRVLYVNPASGLHIDTSLSKPVFRPGETARMNFSITDAEGRPAPAALGIAAVDESVFALAEIRPGLLRQFLDVEGDLLKPRYQIKFFDSPGRLFETENQPIAKAFFASLTEPRSGPDLDDLVKVGYVPKVVIDHARSLRGTPAYDSLRKNPEYAGMMRLLEGEYGTYNFREATGPEKVQRVASYRRRYFRAVEQYAQAGFFAAFVLSPFVLLGYQSVRQARCARHALSHPIPGPMVRFIAVARSLSNQLAALWLLPLLLYPLGYAALEQNVSHDPGWFLLAIETLTVFTFAFIQFAALANAAVVGPKSEVKQLRDFLLAFVATFVISRGGFVAIITSGPSDPWFPVIWAAGGVIVPLLLLGVLGSRVQGILQQNGIKGQVIHMTVIELLCIICILIMLAGLMLPALAKAKAKGMSFSLMNDLKELNLANQMAQDDQSKSGAGAPVTPRVRRDFPETLLWRPELITDDQGKASLEIPLADSITTWRASVDAISAAGNMGSVEAPIRVFQDFFIDLDLPVSMSLGDQISVPVACHNYLKQPQDIRLTLEAADWLDCATRDLTVHLGPNEIKSVSFPIKVLRVGNHPLRVTARGTTISDAIEREVAVVPTGERIEHTQNGILTDHCADTFSVSANAVPDSASLRVTFFPSRFSEIVEGLESIFQAPYGCFEQTSSTTYPNVLVLDYLKRTGKLTPEIEIPARKYINAGYQRLLTFEVPGGGFEWFGRIPANICLTAYGILEFTDMARVHPVDEAVAQRARSWLFDQQNADGSWEEIHRGWTWQGRGSMTAFVAWALAESGDQSVNLDRALDYLRLHRDELTNTYAKALAANALLARDHSDSFGRELAGEIKRTARADGAQAIYWPSDGYSITYSYGSGMEMECTALCAMALMKDAQWPQSVKQAMIWISKSRGANGTFGSTQATILAMRALLEASASSIGQEFTSTIDVLVDDKPVASQRIDKENSDVMRQVDLTKYLHAGENRIAFRQSPPGELPFQIAGAFWLPTQSAAGRAPSTNGPPGGVEPLEIRVDYDHTTLFVNDQLKCSVTVKNHTGQVVNMAIVDLGIPPGFDVDLSAFEAMQTAGRISKYEVTSTQVVLYLREIPDSAPLRFDYSLRAKYPLRVQTPPSAVYEYYQPQNRAQTIPASLAVTAAR